MNRSSQVQIARTDRGNCIRSQQQVNQLGECRQFRWYFSQLVGSDVELLHWRRHWNIVDDGSHSCVIDIFLCARYGHRCRAVVCFCANARCDIGGESWTFTNEWIQPRRNDCSVRALCTVRRSRALVNIVQIVGQVEPLKTASATGIRAVKRPYVRKINEQLDVT